MGRNEAAQAICAGAIEEEVHMDERIVGKLQSDVESIRSDITDMKIDIRELRGDMKVANEAIGELKLDVTAVRAEMKQEFTAVRAEIAAVRTESKNASDAIVARMDARFESMEKTVRLLNTRNIVAMLSIGAGILGAVAKMLKVF
jgi:chromosome segregation ATPase